VIALVGGLGAGKTVFVKGLARGLGVRPAHEVTSPTFVLITEYPGRLTLYHVDAYRLEGAADFEALGADEILFGDGVCVIEWADRLAGCLPEDRLEVALAVEGPLSRRLALSARTPVWGRRWQAMAAALDAAARSG